MKVVIQKPRARTSVIGQIRHVVCGQIVLLVVIWSRDAVDSVLTVESSVEQVIWSPFPLPEPNLPQIR